MNDDIHNALGPLAELYADPEVREILVDAPDRVYINRGGELAAADFRSAATDELRATIDALLALSDITLSRQKTIGETVLPDGSRFLAVIPPTAANSPCFVLARLTIPRMTWEKLLAAGAVTPAAYDLLLSAIHAPANVLIAGGAASGKTTIANLIADSLPADERVIVVEQAREMQTQHPRCLQLEVSGNLAYADLLSTAARMRPDWLVVGEIFGSEALQVLHIFGRGHSGLGTIHAASVEDALARLEALCLMSNLGLGLSDIRLLIAAAFKVITYQRRFPAAGHRRLTDIFELLGIEHDRYVLQPLFRYNPEADRLEPTGAQPSWLAQ